MRTTLLSSNLRGSCNSSDGAGTEPISNCAIRSRGRVAGDGSVSVSLAYVGKIGGINDLLAGRGRSEDDDDGTVTPLGSSMKGVAFAI